MRSGGYAHGAYLQRSLALSVDWPIVVSEGDPMELELDESPLEVFPVRLRIGVGATETSKLRRPEPFPKSLSSAVLPEKFEETKSLGYEELSPPTSPSSV